MPRMPLKGKKLENPSIRIEEESDEQGPYDSFIFENEQVEADMSPLTRHEFETRIKSLVKSIRTVRELAQKDTQNKFESMEIALESAITNTNNLRIETAANFESSRQYQTYLYERGNDLAKYQNSLNERANNLEMKLRNWKILSKEYAIEYVPYKPLPDRHRRGGTRTTIANKYIVS